MPHESGGTPNEPSELTHFVTVHESQQYKVHPDKPAMRLSVQTRGIDNAFLALWYLPELISAMIPISYAYVHGH